MPGQAIITSAQPGETWTDGHGEHRVLPNCGRPAYDVICLSHGRGFATVNERAMHFATGAHLVARVCPVHGFEARAGADHLAR